MYSIRKVNQEEMKRKHVYRPTRHRPYQDVDLPPAISSDVEIALLSQF